MHNSRPLRHNTFSISPFYFFSSRAYWFWHGSIDTVSFSTAGVAQLITMLNSRGSVGDEIKGTGEEFLEPVMKWLCADNKDFAINRCCDTWLFDVMSWAVDKATEQLHTLPYSYLIASCLQLDGEFDLEQWWGNIVLVHFASRYNGRENCASHPRSIPNVAHYIYVHTVYEVLCDCAPAVWTMCPVCVYILVSDTTYV